MDFLRLENTTFYREQQLNVGGKLFTIDKPQVMGIVNCTPDSFYKSSQVADFESQKLLIDKHIQDGALWIDLGAQSTRQNATYLSANDELERLMPALQYVLEKYPSVFVSIDTFQAQVADVCLQTGAQMINDISGGRMQPEIMDVVASYRVPYVLMHTRGTPETMQQMTSYENIVKEVIYELSEQVERAKNKGIYDIVIDPGFGFAKTRDQNFELLKFLDLFHVFERSILVGISRKSMIYKTLGVEPENALNGTTVLNTVALQKGAHFLRVHDVKEAVETCLLVQNLQC